MEAAAREAFTPEVKQAVFAALALDPKDWRDLGGFESFVFANDRARRILRLTHTSHRSGADILAELEFLIHLKKEGAPVCGPVKIGGQWLTEQSEFVCCLFEMAEGRLIEEADWSAELVRAWGSAMGTLHRLSTSFQPDQARRFDWRQDANLDFRGRIPRQQSALLEIGDRYLEKLNNLPQSSANYGLIHSDAHAGNFFLSDAGLKFFDFDDCCYQWFAFDIATILFSAVLQPWMKDGQGDREVVAAQFLPVFLEGYAEQFEVSEFLLNQLPLFLKLREFSLYAVIHSHMDVDHLTDWYPIKFMAGRRERLERDLPYLDIDFAI